LWKLTGGNAVAGALHRTDPTNASRTLLYDIHEQRWDPELCALLDVPLAMLPEVCPSAGLFGETEAFEGLPGGVPVAGIAGDQQAALYGQGCWEPGQAKNTYGTGCFLLMNTGQQHRVSSHGLLTTVIATPKAPRPTRKARSRRQRRPAVAARRAADHQQRCRWKPPRESTTTGPTAPAFPASVRRTGIGARGAIFGPTRGAGRPAGAGRAGGDCLPVARHRRGHERDSGIDTELRWTAALAERSPDAIRVDILGVPVDRP
jgi:glycerol kinase